MRLRSGKTVALLAALTVAAGAPVAVVLQPSDEVSAKGTSGAKPAATAAVKPLPFDLPATATLRKSSRKVFAHYFTPYPVSLDNKPAASDYYTRNYLNPAGEGGKHKAYGGLLRDRPRPRAPLAGDWQLKDMETEVRTAKAAGLDGFTVDLLNLDPSSQHRKRVDLLIKAAQRVDPGFKIVLMPDMTATQIKSLSPAGLATALAKLAASPSVYKLSGNRLLVSPFKAENRAASWFSSLIAALRQKGYNTALVPVFLNFSAHYKSYVPISHGFSNWGNRSPNQQGGIAGNVSKSHALKKIWMQPVAPQDERPNQRVYDEANNTENLRTTWQNAISAKADWIQLTTWNDFSEGTQISPSTHNGSVYLDLTSYYLTRLKTGKWPAIVRDTLYLIHRTHRVSARPTAAGQTKFMSPRPGTSTPRDRVEVLSFLTAPAAVKASIGGQGQAYQAARGVQSRLFPLRFGTNSASVIRAGKTTTAVTSPFKVTQTPRVQDLQYCAVSSRRAQTRTTTSP
ncbi:glycoside hydrolase family 71 protein [Actinomadura fulvescens]|uniref:Glycosyl hydrolase family 71 n=1 Tax=Actinomadura fulvescens TaxID=46160 RepID=A0ABP6CIY8_9ACTN